jgi:hypothetical protein
MIKSSHKRQLGERPELKSSTQSQRVFFDSADCLRHKERRLKATTRATGLTACRLSQCCVQFLIIIRVARNDGAQKFYIVAALVPFLFVVLVEKFLIAAQLESVIENLMPRLVAHHQPLGTMSVYVRLPDKLKTSSLNFWTCTSPCCEFDKKTRQ